MLREVGTRIGSLTALADRVGGIRTLVARVLRVVRAAADVREIGRWADAMSAIHHPTYRHCMLTAGVTAALAMTLGLDRHACLLLVRATLLHDVGKTLVAAEILDKPEPLAPEEMDTLREHPQLGFEMLLAQGDHDPTVLRIVRHHHELLDGSGYPSGLKGDQIDGMLRIATICDVFAALIEERAYKPGYLATHALETMRAMGVKLDQEVLSSLERLVTPG